jgi:hypothetical protein
MENRDENTMGIAGLAAVRAGDAGLSQGLSERRGRRRCRRALCGPSRRHRRGGGLSDRTPSSEETRARAAGHAARRPRQDLIPQSRMAVRGVGSGGFFLRGTTRCVRREINIWRPGTAVGACTLTDAAVPVGGSQPCRPKQEPRKPEAKCPAMTNYPLEFHRRSERQWARRAQAPRSSGLRPSELMPSPRSVRAYGSQPAAERPDFSISLLLNRSAFAAAGSAKKCRT